MVEEKMYGELVVHELPETKRKTRVCIIYTGGTIGMIPTDENVPSSPLKSASLPELMDAVHGLGEDEGIELGLVSFVEPVDSSDISYNHWLAIGQAINEYYNQFDGFVILHGTDTMAFTSSALSFILENLAKPVVITGSQLPIKHRRTDAIQNLTSAVYIAGYKATGVAGISEVVLCFSNTILRGNRATKVSSSQWAGFESPNFPPIGRIGEHIQIDEDLILPKPKEQFTTATHLAHEVKVIPINPGITPEQLERDLKTEGLEGVILMTYGTGNMPTSPQFIRILKEAVEGVDGYSKPLIILNVTQCLEGMVEMGLYEASSGLLEAGVSSGLDLTLEAAIAKMYWALPRFESHIIHNQLQTAKRGEQSQNLFDHIFDPAPALTQANAVEIIKLSQQVLFRNYNNEKLERAILRIQGIGMTRIEPEKPAFIRVFINTPQANQSTPDDHPKCACEFELEKVPENGNVVHDVSFTARNYIKGNTVDITLVGINAKVWCRMVHLSLYTRAE